MQEAELQAQAAEAATVVSGFLPDFTQRRVALRQLAESADYAATVAPNAWSVTLYSNIFRLNVGQVEVLVVGEGFVRLNCVGRVGERPFVGKRFESAGYRSVPEPKCAFVGPLDEFAAIEAILQRHHRRFIETVGRKKNGEPVSGSTHRKSHSPGLLAYARTCITSSDRGTDVGAYWTVDDEALPESTMVEGARLTIQVNAFERNAEARNQCIQHHGTACAICGFTSERVYGTQCAGLIHVHHVRPLSEIGKQHSVDPIHDLRPVCPNCHAVLHSRTPAYSLVEIAAMVASHRVRTPTVDEA